MNFKLTRIAPTPSGFLHLGNLFSFFMTKIIAKNHDAKILLRIDDLDQERVRPEYIQDIFDTLDFMEIPYDFGPKNSEELRKEWSQIHRLDSYKKVLLELREKNLIFACDCSRKKIKQLNPKGSYLGHCLDRNFSLNKKETAWRLDTFKTEDLPLINYPETQVSVTLPTESAFFVVRKKNGFPSYQLSSLADDLNFGVDLIVRGEDLFASSLSQLALAFHLSNGETFKQTTFLHHRLLLGKTKEKLSKTDGAISIQHLRKSGKSKEDILLRLSQKIDWMTETNDFEEFENKLLKKITT